MGWEQVAELGAVCSGYGGPGVGSQPAPRIGGLGGRYHIILVGGDIASGTWLFFGGKKFLVLLPPLEILPLLHIVHASEQLSYQE